MLSGLTWLGLEVKYLDRARTFYERDLDLQVAEVGEDTVQYDVGESAIVLRRPSGVPRGGIHTHYALSIPADTYDDWWDRLSDRHDLDESTFGTVKSLYCYDPDGNCVELGQQDVSGPGIDGIFEIALEVTDLERAERWYGSLGFETVDRGTDRRRVRMHGPMALELWEPQLGIADARGGVHVDIGFRTPDLDRVAAAVRNRACSIERSGDTVTVRDHDGHLLTFESENGTRTDE